MEGMIGNKVCVIVRRMTCGSVSLRRDIRLSDGRTTLEGNEVRF